MHNIFCLKQKKKELVNLNLSFIDFTKETTLFFLLAQHSQISSSEDLSRSFFFQLFEDYSKNNQSKFIKLISKIRYKFFIVGFSKYLYEKYNNKKMDFCLRHLEPALAYKLTASEFPDYVNEIEKKLYYSYVDGFTADERKNFLELSFIEFRKKWLYKLYCDYVHNAAIWGGMLALVTICILIIKVKSNLNLFELANNWLGFLKTLY